MMATDAAGAAFTAVRPSVPVQPVPTVHRPPTTSVCTFVYAPANTDVSSGLTLTPTESPTTSTRPTGGSVGADWVMGETSNHRDRRPSVWRKTSPVTLTEL